MLTVRHALLIPAALLVACGGTDDPEVELPGIGEPGPAPGLTGYHTQGYHTQGYHTQGYATQGYTDGSDPVIKDFLLSSLVEGGSTVDHAYLSGGTIGIDQSITLYNTTSLGTCGSTQYGPWRACSWLTSGVGTCTPYTTVWLGSGPGGSCGPCTGDTMVRVCAGDHACEKGDAYYLNDNDDACGTLCSQVWFSCPASGNYNVMTSSYSSSAASSITLTSSTGAYPIFNSHLTGTDLAGAIIKAEHTDGTLHEYKIAAVAPQPGYPAWFLRYDVQAPTANPNIWASLCDPVAPSTTSGGIVVPGWWTSTGAYVEDPAHDRVTFACDNGVIKKCVGWGYDPAVVMPTSTGGSVTGAQMLATCTRLARADYCGTGVSHTYDLTKVGIWDNLAPHIQVKDPSEPGMLFEAGWVLEGATCLSHLRWDDASPECYTCPQLHDPQIPGQDKRKFCDNEQDGPYMDPSLVHLFNESELNHAP